MQHFGPALPGHQPPGPTTTESGEPDQGGAFGWWTPSRHSPRIPAQRTEEPTDLGSTVVLPYVASLAAKRTRPLRAWMTTLPADVLALVAPIAWSQQYWKATVSAAAVTIGLFAVGGLYRARRHLSVLDELPGLYLRMLTGAAAVAMAVAIRHDSIDNVDGFLRLTAISAILLLPGRLASRLVVLMARRRRWVEHSAIIVGGGPVAVELARLLRRYPQYGLRFGGFVDVASTGHDRRESMPLVGKLDDLEKLVQQTDCDVVIIADVECPESRLLTIVLSPGLRDCDLWMVPRLREFSQGLGAPDHIGAIPVVRLRRPTLDGPKWAVKRTSDLLVASAALLLLSPVMLLCALAVRLEGGPGIIFRQQRIGRHGAPFDLLKFRSMRPVDDQESQTNWNIQHDPRVGPIGRILRRTSLDELPQLWNVLRGDMSIVGPRPERPYFVDRFSHDYPEYAMRHRVPVGLTGLAQVSGLRGDTPISDRARFDNYYIENWSLWLDVKVVLRTMAEVLRAGGR
ncbi:sugar transferase [Actinoplanes palleronii]|uniref:UDP-phosphate galactose phosphotransferase n=1 Tax=Actinoplanes palleronii TaxID=113570 RepID=A0ABQ4B283_9ACTN|nr:sugar transferase [Actinoplanes palleronii]GIE64776.1 UDP-phosphate galactose phosphotransferase [Actinoplanes palleronii]